MVNPSGAPGTRRVSRADRRARVVRTRAATAGMALAALAAGGCSLILDFGDPADAGPPDSPVDDQACTAFEPNDSPTDATVVTAGDYMAAVCGNGETDYFRFTVDGTQSVLARITFMNRNGAGDIDLRLLSGDGSSTIDESRTSNDMEEVMCPGGTFCTGLLPSGDYLLQVFGFSAAVESAYTLHVEITTGAITAGAN